MKVAIMQPYFLPYIGYLQLIEYSDKFVIFDSVQFIDKGWVNRNRILHPSTEKGWQYITYPLSGKSNLQSIKDVSVMSDIDFFSELIAKISHFKKAPYFKEVKSYIEHLEKITEGHESISDINSLILRDLNERLELGCEILSESSIDYDRSAVQHAGQWALEISKALNATSYVNPIGGKELFIPGEYRESNIELEFLETDLVPYKQYRGYFEPGLSIIDVLLWNGFLGTKDMITNHYKIRSAEQ